MAYYDALIAKWPSVTGADTAAKLANLNGQTATGSVPTTFTLTGDQILNAIVLAEFTALSAANQTNVWNLVNLASTGSLNAGTGTFVQNLMLSIFGVATTTRANLTALAKGAVVPWWQANGYGGPINLNDLRAAGNLT